jgi:SET domain-containing protein
MFLVPTILKKSSIHGLGVFSGVKIRKDELVWKMEPDKVQVPFTVEEMEHINKVPRLKSMFQRHSYMWHGKTWLDIDNGTFMNHSDNPNLRMVNENGTDVYYANKDIDGDEELTCDYREFDLNWHEKVN